MAYTGVTSSCPSFFFFFLVQGFSVPLEPVLELALVVQAGLEHTEICLPLPPSAGIKGVRHHHSASSCPFIGMFSLLLLEVYWLLP